MKKLYTPDDIAGLNYANDLGSPGEYPFTRGVQRDMYLGKLWTMRQYAGFGTAEETNRRYKYLLEQGQTGLSVAFDLPTQIGYDSDHPLAKGEVGKTGVAIDSLRDMEILFGGIPLDEVSSSMTINSTAAILLAMYVALAKKTDTPLEKLSGTIQNDILKEYIARGTYVFPPRESMRLIVDTFKFCNDHLPKFNPISISGYHIREAGATAVQEIAFTFTNGIAYVKAALSAGMQVEQFASRLSFFFSAHSNFLEEIAKFRAARRLWARIMRESFKVKDDNCCRLRFHTQTAGSTLTAQQVDNNIVRVAFQALAAVLGGTQSLHTNSKDEALGLPSEDAAQTALRTQQIIAYESGVAETVDPLAGSYAIESLTDQLEEESQAQIDLIENNGGALWAVESGYYKREIERSAYEHQRKLENQQKIVVGMNKFSVSDSTRQDTFKVDSNSENQQIEALISLRSQRDNRKVRESLDCLSKNLEGNGNLLPYIIDCVESYATLGEICDRMREAWGEYRESIVK